MRTWLAGWLEGLALRPRAVYALGTAGTAERWALEGERVAFPELPLLYLSPRGRGWIAEPAPQSRLRHICWRNPGREPQPLPAGPLTLARGVELCDRRTGVRLVLFPGVPPTETERRQAAHEDRAQGPCGFELDSRVERVEVTR